ncbi:MAG: Hpt domain-containing protein [Paracoccaceae bacterium]
MIDWDRVDELRNEIGEDGFGEIAAVFLEEVGDAIDRLAAATTAEGLAAELHFIKGGALNLGLGELGALCQHGEQAARVGQPADIDRIRQVFALSRAELAHGTGLHDLAA